MIKQSEKELPFQIFWRVEGEGSHLANTPKKMLYNISDFV